MRAFRAFGNLARSLPASALVKKGRVSPPLRVPPSIAPPPYVAGGPPPPPVQTLEIKDAKYMGRMRAAAVIAREVLMYAGSLVRPGISTDDIDKAAHAYMIDKGVYPSPLGYCGFPKSICTSVNNVICHGIPDDRVLLDGDVVKIDVSVFVNGVHGDNCHTFYAGTPSPAARALVHCTHDCMMRAIAACGPGVPFDVIGRIISNVAGQAGFGVVERFTGHGIGADMHMYPHVFHVPTGNRLQMQPGITFTIEPMVTAGSPDCSIWDDGWSVVTADNSLAAQFEHTVAITENGAEIITTLADGSIPQAPL